MPPVLAFVEARWVGGTAGDDRVPGPSLYFIEAVVVLAPADTDRLRSRYASQPASTPPRPPGSLQPFVQADPTWTASAELVAEGGPPGWQTRVYVDLGARIAYVSVGGE